jgi:signal transduction histidine kinase
MTLLKSIAQRMKSSKEPIRISLDEELDNDYIEICYDESLILKRLASYPYVQLCVVFVFVLIVIFALLSSKKMEQNKVWVGLSKETAHQLGTPISSLMAWTEILKDKYVDDDLIPEMSKDVNRLQVIADRFSKIGSMPEPKDENLNEVLERVLTYIERRASNKVKIIRLFPSQPVVVRISASLFEWVIENLCKNAIDAMDGQGVITLSVVDYERKIEVNVEDTGKGISKSHRKSVFTPGFTTKKRGWGLGLSLAKRIVEEYHKGRIYVKSSEVNKGTIFSIELKK